jgi:predicted ABC-type ATPase
MLIVGGPNGSGKTTLALEFSQEFGLPYVGADAIAEALNPANPVAAQVAAGRQFLQTLGEYRSQKTSCVCESTLSGLTMRNFIASAQQAGYSIDIAFLFVDSADACVARVAERVRKGGHNVPESDIRRRFTRSLCNFWRIYRELADNWVLIYNGITTMQDVATGSRDQTTIRNHELYSTYLTLVGETP